MKIMGVGLLLIAYSSTLLAHQPESVIVAAPFVDSIAMAEVQSRLPQSIPYSQLWMKREETNAKAAELLETFQMARNAELKNNSELARTYYSNIIQERLENDWASDVLFLIRASYQALLKLETNRDERMRLLADYIAFDSTHLNLPSNIASEYDAVREAVQKNTIELAFNREEFRHLDVILIDSRPMKRPFQDLRLPRGSHRVTFLSDRAYPETYVRDADALASVKPAPRPFLEGSCVKPRVPLQLLQRPVVGAYKPDCVHQPQTQSNVSSSLRRPLVLPMTTSELHFDDNDTSILKSPYFWIGAAVLTGVMVKAVLDQQKTEETKTIRVARPGAQLMTF